MTINSDGFFFDELTEVQKDIMRSVNKLFPEKTKKFLVTSAQKLNKVAKQIAKEKVGTSKKNKKDWSAKFSYQKGFKVGKKYEYEGDMAIRVYNKAPHGHLIEYGHMNYPRGKGKKNRTKSDWAEAYKKKKDKNRKSTGFTKGAHVLETAQNQYREEYLRDAEKFMLEFVDDTVNGKF